MGTQVAAGAVDPRAPLRSDRILLRRWKLADRAPFAAMNRDPQVMQHFPSLLNRRQSDQMVDRVEAHFEKYGFGLWAAELRATQEFIGFVGLSIPRFQAAFTPCVEIGWRLAPSFWGSGLATEGAKAVACHAFAFLKMHELVSFTVPSNIRSRRVMEKLGMSSDPAEDFDHPKLPEGHALRRHVLYRLAPRDALY
jgi:RimJ/RimL family protein N-acetyltransferase